MPYAISVGYHQARVGVGKFIDMEKCARDGIDVVSRPTGGRAVLHAEEVTYSVVMKTTETASRVYAFISSALLAGLKSMDASNQELQRISGFKQVIRLPILREQSICFASSAKNEINYLGRKLVGSAQRMFGDIVLQHGSILIGDYHKKIVNYLFFEDGDVAGLINERTTCLNEIMGKDVSYDEVKNGLIRGFTENFGEMKERIPGALGITPIPR